MVLLASPAVSQFNKICDEVYDTRDYYNLYFKLEEALIEDRTAIETMRVKFLHSEVVSIFFSIKMCPLFQYCSNCSLNDIVYSSLTLSSSNQKKVQIVDLITFHLSLLHGNLLSTYVFFLPYEALVDTDTVYLEPVSLNLIVDNLADCDLVKCVLGDLLTWVSTIVTDS